MDEHSERVAKLLYGKMKREETERSYASTKRVLTILGAGATIAAVFIAPKIGYELSKSFWREEGEWDDWKKFNHAYLRQTLRRFEKQKLVEIRTIRGKERITITNAGKKKIIEYAIEELEIAPSKNWDRKWRMVLYDIPTRKKRLQEVMRKELKKLGLLAINESVYITPYPCYDEVEFLRQYYNLGGYIKFLLIEKLEDDSAYKQYFGLK